MKNALIDYISRFMKLTDEETSAILDLNLFKNFKKGTILLSEGELSNEGYFVIKGCIRCYYIINGEEKTTAFYTESESLSPLCSINHKPSEYFVSCIEDSILVVANSDMEKIMFERFPRFETLCRIISEELVVTKQAIFDEFKTSTPEQRYLNLVKTRPDLIQRVPQYQLASFLGMKPESLSRIRKRLTAQESH